MQEEEIIYEDIQASEEQDVATVEEVEQVIDVTDIEPFNIEVDEAFPASGEVDAYNHATLYNRELYDAHPITAITGLREELNSIEALQTIYSDKKGNADYYEWADGHALGENGVGYFVTLNKDYHTISICTGDDIYGVVVSNAAFVGGQDDVARDAHYGLVATSGVVCVRCEIDVAEGDYVVCNAKGYAKKSDSDYGYKVVALVKTDTIYAIIALGIQADQFSELGKDLDLTKKQVDANYRNIVSAINVASQAYNKATEVVVSNQEMSDKVDEALKDVGAMSTTVKNMSAQMVQTQAISVQAKAVAESAATSAMSIKDEAVAEAKNALEETSKLREEFGALQEGINEIEDQVTIVTKKVNGRYEIVDTIVGVDKEEIIVYYAKDTELYHYYDYDARDWAVTTNPRESGLSVAIAGIQVETDENSASVNNLVSWQGNADTAMARIEQKADASGAYIKHAVTNMDKYRVGLHSHAYGFTLEQATNILDEGTFYVPTEDYITEEYKFAGEAIIDPGVDNRNKTKVYYILSENKEPIYYHWGYSANESKYTWLNSTDFPTYKRTFMTKYLYQWGVLESGLCGWVTVDRFNQLIQYDETEVDAQGNRINTSSEAVYFTSQMVPSCTQGGQYGYWYTDGDELGSAVSDYELHTLYKWESYQKTNLDGTLATDDKGNPDLGYHWVSVASIAGNSQTRAVSQIRQDANSITAEIVDAFGSVAGFGSWLSNTEAKVQSLTSWRQGEDSEKSNAAIIKQTSDANGSSIIISTYEHTDDGTEEGKVENQASLTLSSATVDGTNSLVINAKNIVLDGNTTFTTDDGGETKIHGAHIATGTIDATKINAEELHVKAANVDGTLTADQIYVNDLNALDATLGGFSIGDYTVASGTKMANGDDGADNMVGMCSSGNCVPYAFWAGEGNFSSKPFKVGHDGFLEATSAKIAGNVTAKSGKIGGFTLDTEGGLYSDTEAFGIYTKDVKFVDDNTLIVPSLINSGYNSVIRLYAGSYLEPCEKTFTRVPLRNLTVVQSTTHIHEYTVTFNFDVEFDYKEELGENSEVRGCICPSQSVPLYNIENFNASCPFEIETNLIGVPTGLVKYIGGFSESQFTSFGSMETSRTIKSRHVHFLEDDAVEHTIVEIGDGYDGWPTFDQHIIETSGSGSTRRVSISTSFFEAPSEIIKTSYPSLVLKDDSCVMLEYERLSQNTELGDINSVSYEIEGSKLKLTGEVIWRGLWNVAIDEWIDHNFAIDLQLGLLYVPDITATDPKDHAFMVCDDGSVYMSQSQVSTLSIGDDTGASITSDDGDSASLSGTWNMDDDAAVTSWRGAKYDIENLPEKYSALFDNLKPVRFKYYHGNSERYHTGFILDEMKDAMDIASVDTSEFAAYCVNDAEIGKGGIRYSELIALNVAEIQQLKKRVAELEIKLKELTEASTQTNGAE